MDSDINYIIQQSLNGDKNYQEILLNKLVPLIYRNIYKYWDINDPIVDDLVQEGYIVILESLKTFDKSRGVHFLYYAKIKLIYYYKNYFRKTKKDRTLLSISKEFSDKSLEFEKILSDKFNLLEFIVYKEEITELLSAIEKLSVKQQEILYLYYYKRLTLGEISKNLNISYRTVIGTKYTAIKKIKNLMRSKG
ncbi:MAG: sigma-70 family RNA polymerase sigma factor [Sedimentibacter sp.]|uniref:RNA polymerase sigma factor n=1 Tax=Sedimentibacter sp. TaxID=1960295 RepID=UPI0029814079|nr:sigma-70 family RNA polymerase sigma factor [Sedimentibacter sp.]MDW5298666.1 sigma-70 family RNA polymerase sigma factor [Sedimentibacter sp.]